MSTTHRFAVVGALPVLADVVEWYADVSCRRAVLQPNVLGEVQPADGWTAFSSRGGLGPPPSNSQGLAAAVLARLDPPAVAAAGGRTVIVTPAAAGFAPHVWRHRSGGFWLGGRAWARRYAVVPADATLGVVAHELGHLLFGWADHDRRSGIGADCLMGTGAAATIPAWPCAPTRVAAGWTVPTTAKRNTLVGDLTDGRVVQVGTRLIERGPGGDVLVYNGDELVARTSADPGRPLLGAVASTLRHRASKPALSQVAATP